jgi:hypothetical protein
MSYSKISPSMNVTLKLIRAKSNPGNRGLFQETENPALKTSKFGPVLTKTNPKLYLLKTIKLVTNRAFQNPGSNSLELLNIKTTNSC